jgi:hypothetical protein
MSQESDESFGEKKLKKRGRPPARKVCDECIYYRLMLITSYTAVPLTFIHARSLSDRLHSIIGVGVEEVGTIESINEE